VENGNWVIGSCSFPSPFSLFPLCGLCRRDKLKVHAVARNPASHLLSLLLLPLRDFPTEI